MSDGHELHHNLLREISTLVLNGGLKPNERFKRESKVAENIIKFRNANGILVDEYASKGLIISRKSNFDENEERFSNIWKAIIYINNKDVDYTKYDEQLQGLVDMDSDDPIWYELKSKIKHINKDNEEEVRTQILPAFRLCDYEYYKERFNNSREFGNIKRMNTGKKTNFIRLPEFQGLDNDYEIELPYALNFKGYRLTKLSRFLKERINAELNPYYATHPLSLLYVTILYIKALHPSYVSFGIRYLELYMNKYSLPGVEYHYPFEFRSDGDFVSIQFHSHAVFRFKYILNFLVNILMYEEVHKFDESYMEIADLSMIEILEDVNAKGKKLKSAFNMFNLYYGMSCKHPSNYNRFDQEINSLRIDKNDILMEDSHLHPKYPLFGLLDSYDLHDVAYQIKDDCTGCSITSADKGTFTIEVAESLKESINKMVEEGFTSIAKHSIKKLLCRRPSEKIINDVLFIRILMNSGGFAHTHKIMDFDQINDNFELNEKYMQPKNYVKTSHFMAEEMRNIGRRQTKRLINEGKYPTGVGFRNSIQKHVTSKSSGLPPIDVKVTIDGEIKKTKFNSKSAYIMLRGYEALDLSTVNVSNEDFFNDVKKDITETKFKDQLTKQEENAIYREYGISKIGSRSTVAFRDVRAIFITPFTSHLAQAALIYPHIIETTHRPANKPRSIFINEDYGSCIATMYMDGSTDLIAPAVMASASGDYVSLLSDCSQWDQTFVSMDSMNFYKGVEEAFFEARAICENEIYMYNKSKGMSLMDIAEWFNDLQRKRLYVAEYAGELKVYNTNFMWSGRLDTFFLNCIQNQCCNREISRRLKEENDMNGFGFLTIAGDDVAATMKADNWSAKKTTALKEVTVDVYTSTNHKINIKKSAVSSRSGEYAKLYWYYGMMFRDPSIQMFESEKNQKTVTRVEFLRGYSQKMFEFIRRAKTSMNISSTFCRLILAVSYSLDIMPNGKDRHERRVKIRYVPPYQSVVCPTFVKGGLGFTVTGLTINESLFIRKHLDDWMELALPYLSVMKSEIDNKLASTLFEYYSGVGKNGKSKKYNKDITIEYDTNDPEVVGADFAKGLSYRRLALDKTRVNTSNQAIKTLNESGITLSQNMVYSTSGDTSFLDSLKTMIISKDDVNQSLEANMSEIFKIYSEDKVRFNDIPKIKYASLLKLYEGFTFTTARVDNPNGFKNASIRYVSVPTEGMMLEKHFGAKTGKESISSLKGFQLKIRRFIKDCQLPYTENQVISAIVDAGIFSADNIQSALYNCLLAISGMSDESYNIASSINEQDVNWSSEIISVNVVGTVLENLNISEDIIDSYINIRKTNLPKPFTKMIKYSAFILMLQEWIWFNDRTIVMDVGITQDINNILRTIRPFTEKKRMTNLETVEHNVIFYNIPTVFGNGFVNDSEV
nr:MAG: RNA-dependent RNA polymerase [Jingmen bat reovirus 1]